VVGQRFLVAQIVGSNPTVPANTSPPVQQGPVGSKTPEKAPTAAPTRVCAVTGRCGCVDFHLPSGSVTEVVQNRPTGTFGLGWGRATHSTTGTPESHKDRPASSSDASGIQMQHGSLGSQRTALGKGSGAIGREPPPIGLSMVGDQGNKGFLIGISNGEGGMGEGERTLFLCPFCFGCC
jgi:hypothetical protein